jgi:predicted glycosyltransferase involved in capsule biosynthesis
VKKVCIVRLLDSGFNKARLLNQGILQATSEYVLVSDADILWNSTAIEALLSCASSCSKLICHVQDVRESDNHSIALQRDRYTYQLRQNAEAAFIEVVPAKKRTQYRPGYGLILTRRNTLLKLGGYKELFQGWGWEDQDLLIRAGLLGVQVDECGKVTHLSHTDEMRNRYHNNLQPSQTRNRNIITCLKALTEGKLLGDLPVEAVSQTFSKRVSVKLPNSLIC